MEAALQFPIGQVYLIISKNGQGLRIDDPNKHENSRISTAPSNPQDTNQLFFVQKIGENFEITNAISGYVFDEESGEIRLKKGKQNSDQLFSIERADLPGYQQYFWIKTDKSGKKALKIEGILRYDTFDPNDERQLFRLQPINNNSVVNSSTVIINARSGKALDVKGATNEKGERVIQYSKNRKFHQRWVFVKASKGYNIVNLKTGLYLDVSGESKKPNSKVIQWQSNGNINQQFTFEKGTQQGQWVIRCVHEPSLVLGIEDNDVNDGGKLAIVNHNAEWILEGAFPK